MNGRPAWAAIGLGGNLGDRARTLDDAEAALAETPGVKLVAVSSYHQTKPAGGPEGQGAYLNAAMAVETTLGPVALLHALQRVEHRAGRVRAERWGARTLDLDLLLVGQLRVRTPELTVPHPLMAVRRFVLAPLAEIAPGAVHPTSGRTVAELLAHIDRRPPGVEVIDGDEPRRRTILARLGSALPPSWIVGDAAPACDPTFRVFVGGPAIDGIDAIPTVVANMTEADAIADFILALCRATERS